MRSSVAIAPPIALNAADQPLAVVVDLDQRAMEWGQVSPKATTGDCFSFALPRDAI